MSTAVLPRPWSKHHHHHRGRKPKHTQQQLTQGQSKANKLLWAGTTGDFDSAVDMLLLPVYLYLFGGRSQGLRTRTLSLKCNLNLAFSRWFQLFHSKPAGQVVSVRAQKSMLHFMAPHVSWVSDMNDCLLWQVAWIKCWHQTKLFYTTQMCLS